METDYTVTLFQFGMVENFYSAVSVLQDTLLLYRCLNLFPVLFKTTQSFLHLFSSYNLSSPNQFLYNLGL